MTLSRASWSVCVALGVFLLPRPALAQSADDVAARVGTVARAMGKVADDPWTVDAVLAGNLSKGNTDSSNFRTSVVYVRDSGAWRFGSYLSASLENTNGVRNKERAGLNLAVARRFSEEFRIVFLEELVRAPLDGLRARNLLGGMLVWTPDGGGRVESSYYVGAGWASEHFTDDEPTSDYGALLTGATTSVDLTETSKLNLVASFSDDLTETSNYKFGSSIALDVTINSVMGLAVAYALAYDNAPADARRKTNNTISVGLTLGWKGEAAADTGG